MKRHADDMANKSKRYSYTSDSRPMPQPSPQPSTYYPYQSAMWNDPRIDKNHGNLNMGNVFSPPNMMMQWNSPTPPMYNPLQPPPPLPLERPPIETPPPPPPHNHMQRRNMMGMNNNMRRRPQPGRPDQSGYLGPYKKNNQLNHGHKNGPNHNHNNSNISGPSTSSKSNMNDKQDDGGDKQKTTTTKVNRKARRKPMSERYTCKKEWNKEDAMKALTLENAYNHLIKKVPMLILRFPDPELNKALIHSYSPAIETVHFQQPSRARYCFVQLKPESDIEEVKKEISQIDFGTGKISVENKITRHEVAEVTPEQLDPYTLYVGNLPTKLNVTIFKEKFPTAKRIDIGYAQRTKFTRYAFLHYDSVEDSMEAFKTTYNLTIDARSLVVRFRRNKGSVGLSEKGKKIKKDEDGENSEATEDAAPPRKEPKQPSNTPLFDDEFDQDSKANVLNQAEKLRQEERAQTSSPAASEDLQSSFVKQEPLSDDEFEDSYAFDNYMDPFADDYNRSDEEYEIHEDEESNDGDLENKRYGRRHWERHDDDEPMVSVKEEKTDEVSEDGDFDSTTDFESTLPIIPQLQPQTKQEPRDDDDIFNNLNSFGED